MDTILITGVTNGTSNTILIPNRAITTTNLINGGKYYLRLACATKGLATSTNPVLIQTSAANLPLLDKFGNVVGPNQLFTRKNYVIGYGKQNTSVYGSGQFVMQEDLCYRCAATTSSSAEEKVVTKSK